MVSIRFLVQTAIGGGVFAMASISGMIYYIQRKFQSQEFYTRSIELLKNYEPAGERLGKPVLYSRLNIGELHHNYTDGINARLKIPLKGSTTYGSLYVLASRETPKESWNIDKLDLEIPSDFQRWTFYYNPRDPSKVTITGGSNSTIDTSTIDTSTSTIDTSTSTIDTSTIDTSFTDTSSTDTSSTDTSSSDNNKGQDTQVS